MTKTKLNGFLERKKSHSKYLILRFISKSMTFGFYLMKGNDYEKETASSVRKDEIFPIGREHHSNELVSMY